MDSSAQNPADLSFDQLMELDRRAEARELADDGSPSDPGDTAADESDLITDRDDTIVLPWWQHPVNILTMVLTMGILAAMVGWMIGDARSQMHHSDVDSGFLQDMREHHEQAVLMSFIYRTRDDIDPGLNTIARSIIVGQSLEVGRMIQLLRDLGESEVNESEASMLWMGMSATPGQMPGMASDDELDQLGRVDGREADVLFTRLMIEHHEGGIEMAEFAAENGANDEVRAMATSMASAQRGEIAEMLGVLDPS